MMSDSTPLRFAVDTGGTFTDLVIEGDPQGIHFYKRPTTPADPIRGVLDVVEAAATGLGMSSQALLANGELFIHGTTRASNAIVEGATAKTAFLTTKGHRDILLHREGAGRATPLDYSLEYPDPYIPRSLTFEIPERTRSNGTLTQPLDEEAVRRVCEVLRDRDVEAVAVCLLWSIINPSHELRVGELLREHLPEVPFTLSHQLNPALREYRRASSAAIDASLQPVMSTYIGNLERRLEEAGFNGRLLVLTSAGGILDAQHVAETPIHSIGSGPAAGPVAGRHFARLDAGAETAVISDAGGTTFDVSLIRRGSIPWTRETIVGDPNLGFMTGFPSVDVRSVGAGGGSVGWVDAGGLLHVGPQSAGADPGPACYGRGGTRATVTDACMVLGYIDPGYFLGGRMEVDVAFSEAAIEREVASPLGLGLREAAAAILDLACDRMVTAIEQITLNQGIDPHHAVMVAGGGGAGLYSATIARRLGSPRVVIPEVSAALSAAGALLSDLQTSFASTEATTTASFDAELANRKLAELHARCREFVSGPGASAVSSDIRFSVEARYPRQVWEIEVPLTVDSFTNDEDVENLRQDFHRIHEQLFAVDDPDSPVEIVTWRASVRCALRHGAPQVSPADADHADSETTRRDAFFAGTGATSAPVHRLDGIRAGRQIAGPAIVESPVTTVVVPPAASIERVASGSLVLHPWTGEERASHEP